MTRFAILAAVLLHSVSHAAIIEVREGDTSAGSWGPGHGSYGQVFTAPSDESLLSSYQFQVQTVNDSFPYVSQIYLWSLDRPNGPALYTSEIRSSPPPANHSSPESFLPSIVLASGQQYIAILTNQPFGVSVGGPLDGSVGGQIALKSGNPYSGGHFTFAGGNPETGRWSPVLISYDAVFRAEFTSASVPAPSSLVTLCGLLTVVLTSCGGGRLPRFYRAACGPATPPGESPCSKKSTPIKTSPPMASTASGH